MTKTLFCGLLLSMILLLPTNHIGVAQTPPAAISVGNISRITEVARLGKGNIFHFDWTPEHQLMVTTSAGIWLYNADSLIKDVPTPLQKEYPGQIVAVVGKSIFLAYQDHSLSVQDSETGQERPVLPSSNEDILDIAISPDGTKLAFSRSSVALPVISSKDSFAIHVWDVQTAKELYQLGGQTGRINPLQFSPDGKVLIAVSVAQERSIALTDVQTGKEINRFYASEPISIAFNAKGNLLAAGNVDGTIQLWDIRNDKALNTFQTHQRSVDCLAFSPDGQTLASAGGLEPDIKIWKSLTGQAVAILKGHQNGVFALSFSPNGLSLVSGSDDETVREWDTKTWTQKVVLNGFLDSVSSIAFVPKSDVLVSGTASIQFWNIKTATSTQMVRPNPTWAWVEGLAITPDGKQLTTADNDSLQIWDIATMSNPIVLEKGEIRHVAVSSTGLLASTLAGMNIKLWDIRKQSLLYTLTGHQDYITDLVFSPSGDFLASVSGVIQGDVVYTPDNTLRIWDVHTGAELATLEGANHLYSVAVSPDATLIATGTSDGIIQLWSIETKTQVARLTGANNIIYSLVFSHDGSLLFAGGSDELIHVWDVKAKNEVQLLKGQLGLIHSLTLNTDGTFLASGSADGTIRVWGIR